MVNNYIFNFKSDISSTALPDQLNNPFRTNIPSIAKIAVQEFQDFITKESKSWGHDFHAKGGKMFGILVVQNEDKSYGYLGTISGNLPRTAFCKQFTPPVFDESTDDFFINKGMTELTIIGNKIKQAASADEVSDLKEKRRLHSLALQKRLFENSIFLNTRREKKNVLQIFEASSQGNPPSAAGECAAPKLLYYAIKSDLKPIAIAEFWWGKTTRDNERTHKHFYPACKNKCRPILEYILDDFELFETAIDN